MFSRTRFADLQQFIWTRLYSLLKNLQKFTRFTRACPVATEFELNLKQYPVSVNIMLICPGRAIKILNRTSENYKLGWLWWYFFKLSMMICFGYTLTTAVRSSVFFGLGALVFGTIDSANLQKPVNRLGIIMGRFGCTSSSEKKKWFSVFCFGIFCPEV